MKGFSIYDQSKLQFNLHGICNGTRTHISELHIGPFLDLKSAERSRVVIGINTPQISDVFKWTTVEQFDDLAQDCSISSADALEILQSCAKSWICGNEYRPSYVPDTILCPTEDWKHSEIWVSHVKANIFIKK